MKLVLIETSVGPKWMFPDVPGYWVRNFNGHCGPGYDEFQAFKDIGHTNKKVLRCSTLEQIELELRDLIKGGCG